MRQFILDLAERTAATYVQAFLGLMLADGFDLLSIGELESAALAAIPAALAVVKSGVATFVGDPASAALLPSGRRDA